MREMVMSPQVLYSDRFVEIVADSILLRGYTFPGLKAKRVFFSDIDCIALKKPTLWTGKYRFHGTGDFRTWFASDWNRSTRDRIFVIHPKRGWWRMGFSVEDSGAVEKILRSKGLTLLQQP